MPDRQRLVKKQRRSIREAPNAAAAREHSEPVVGSKLPAIDVDRLARLAELRKLGILSREEYEEQKARILRADV